MIVDTDRSPKGITIVRLPQAGTAANPARNLADVIPLVDAGVGDARQWRSDLTTNQAWDWQAATAQNPLANGTKATNHWRKEPAALQYEAVVTDTPFLPFGSPLASAGGLPGIRRADELWASLKAMYERGEFVAVVAPVAILETALITGLVLNRTADDGSAYFITISVREQQTFELKLLPSVDDAASQLGARITDAGGVIIG